MPRMLGSSGGSGAPVGGSGWVIISDMAPQGSGAVSNKVFQDPAHTVLLSCTTSTLSVRVHVIACYPDVTVDTTPAVLTKNLTGEYEGDVSVTLTGSETLKATVTSPNGDAGAFVSCAVTVDAPPVILTLDWSSAYPGSQTELKAGDVMQVSGTTDKVCVGLNVSDFGACGSQVLTFASTTTFTASVTIADRGTTLQSLKARMGARNAAGAVGATHDTASTVDLNNLHPSVSFGAKVYPATQGALKNSETCSVAMATANLDSILYDSPTAELSIASPTVDATPKVVTRIAGSYNDSVNNLRCTATRAANAAQTVAQTVIEIANVAPTITVATPYARLRSGGNNGTAVQNYSISLTSDQKVAAPTLDAGASGAFSGSWAGGPKVWTRSLAVADSDAKGTFTWAGLVATNLAGLTQNTVGTGDSYVLGGFVARTLTFAAFVPTTSLNVACVDYSKLQAGIFTATNQPALRNASRGDHSDILNTFTVDAISTTPTTVYWNDAAAVSANSSGSAQITGIEEIV